MYSTIKFRYSRGHTKVGAEMYTVGIGLKKAYVGIRTLWREPKDTGTAQSASQKLRTLRHVASAGSAPRCWSNHFVCVNDAGNVSMIQNILPRYFASTLRHLESPLRQNSYVYHIT
jgi:hypothetical protein